MKKTYDDMIDMPHHVSDRHPQMPMAERAAQFSPFAALSGYGDVIRETEARVRSKVEEEEREDEGEYE